MRVGLATGLAVVGDLIGTGAAQEQAVIGETPNLAARLQALAGPDQIVIPENTRRLVGNLFEYESLGEVEVKGLPAPVLAFRVVRESRAGSRFEALRTGETPLVGRDEEIELLSRRWVQAKAGKGQVVLVSAEPGIGKSRLTEAFRRSLDGEPHTRLRCFCSPHHQDSALFPFIAQLERAAGFEREDTPSAKLHKLEALLAANEPAEGDVQLLAELLSVAYHGPLPCSRPHPAAQEGKDVRGLITTAGWFGPAAPRADDLRRSALGRSHFSRAPRPYGETDRADAGAVDRDLSTRVSAALERPAACDDIVSEAPCSRRKR